MPYPDDYRTHSAPDRTLTPEQERQEGAERVADAIHRHAERISGQAFRLYSDAVAGFWSCPLSPSQIEALEQDMTTLAVRLERLRDGWEA